MRHKLALLHPFLFSSLFVLMPYTQYAGLIPATQAVVPFIVVCVFALFSYVVIKLIVKKRDVTAAILSPLLITLLYGVHLYDQISFLTAAAKFHVPIMIFVTLTVLIILAVYIVKILRAHEATIKSVNGFFCVIACGLIIFNIFSISGQYISTTKIIDSLGKPGITSQKHAAPLPDIYYVILDEYAAPSQMKSYFHYEVSPFVEHLKREGFMVTEMMTPAPCGTMAILENLLNMEAKNITDVTAVSCNLSDRILQSMNLLNTDEEKQMIHVRNNKVVNYLKSMGYQYIHIGSWLPQTGYNQLADQNINCFGFQFANELPEIIVSNSLRILKNRYSNHYLHRKAVLDAFTTLEQMPVTAGKPRFIFAHIICPHTPYVFGAHGERVGSSSNDGKDYKQLYIDQHIFVTAKVKELVDHIISSSPVPPIIVIQADHGARMDRIGSQQVFTAVYMHPYKGPPWPDSTPSSDTFRLLFDRLFASDSKKHS